MATSPLTAIGDLVPLICRARWVRFGLFSEVRFRTADTDSGAWEQRGRLEVAPDGWYRVDVKDGEATVNCRPGIVPATWCRSRT